MCLFLPQKHGLVQWNKILSTTVLEENEYARL